MSEEQFRLPPRRRRTSTSALITEHVLPTELSPLVPSTVPAAPQKQAPAVNTAPTQAPALNVPAPVTQPAAIAEPPAAPVVQSVRPPEPLPFAPGGTKRTFYLSNEVQYLLTNAQIAMLDTGEYPRESNFVEAALREKIQREQDRRNAGQPFPRSPFQQRATGRPPKNQP